MAVSFQCQKQLDMFVAVAPHGGGASEVYSSYMHATGLPPPLLSAAALFWQSKSTYHDQAEVVTLAKNFSDRNLTVGLIVIAHDAVPCSPQFKNCTPPYYRMNPQRWPDVAGMVKQVADLTGARIMPNIKPTSLATVDCAVCGLLGVRVGQKEDGEADDGLIDPSTAACASCLWKKRVKPFLFDKGITTYWLDDDEANKFDPKSVLPPLPSPGPQLAPSVHAPRFRCGPRQYCGMWLAGLAWPQAFATGIESEGGPEASKPLILSRNAWAGAAGRGVSLWSTTPLLRNIDLLIRTLD